MGAAAGFGLASCECGFISIRANVALYKQKHTFKHTYTMIHISILKKKPVRPVLHGM